MQPRGRLDAPQAKLIEPERQPRRQSRVLARFERPQVALHNRPSIRREDAIKGLIVASHRKCFKGVQNGVASHAAAGRVELIGAGPRREAKVNDLVCSKELGKRRRQPASCCSRTLHVSLRAFRANAACKLKDFVETINKLVNLKME